VLDLPPPYSEIALREGGDAFVRATDEARAGAGAGLLVWVRRHGSVDCAVVLEPEEPLAEARQVLFAGLAAIADSLAAISPPEKPLELVWPDRVHFDGGLVGGARVGWPLECAEDATPEWLVLGFTLRTLADSDAGEPVTALIDEGFDDFENGPFIESFARHFMLALDQWSQGGPPAAIASCQRYGAPVAIDGPAAARQPPSWLVDGEIGR
jgi:biotin-(acetyl-CoA carboxylase) ligase